VIITIYGHITPILLPIWKALSKAPDGSGAQEAERKTVAEFEKKIRMMDLNQDARISFIELHSGVSADMEMQMLLGCGDEADDNVGGEDDEEMLCAFCKVLYASPRSRTKDADDSVTKYRQNVTKFRLMFICRRTMPTELTRGMYCLLSALLGRA